MTDTSPEPTSALDAADLENIARGFHAQYLQDQRGRKPPSDPAMQPWEALLPGLRDSNRALARDVSRKLALLGLEIRAAERKPGVSLSTAEVERLAEAEHERWNAERFSAGWTLGPRDPETKRSPYLVAYGELPENVKEYDRETVRAIPKVLAASGYGLARRGKPLVFMIRDFILKQPLETYVERALELSRSTIDWDVPGITDGTQQGHLFEDGVRQRMHGAHRVLVSMDLSNGNVAFEVGHALGRGAEVALFHVGNTDVPPAWTTGTPFEGYGIPRVRNGQGLVELATSSESRATIPRLPVPTKGEGVLLLAPSEGPAGDAADSLIGALGAERFLSVRQPSWSWPKAPGQLGNVGTILWLIENPPEGERDGIPNTVHAAVAGYLTAFGDRSLHVFQHRSVTRRLVDLAGEIRTYGRLEDLRAQVSSLLGI